jgi:hypothetical protein
MGSRHLHINYSMKLPGERSSFVMAGLVPAIHVLFLVEKKDVDARHKAGHDR